MCTRSGIFYFAIFNDYSASFSLMLMLILEIVLVVYIYGIRNYLADLRLMFGKSRHLLGKLFGPTGYYIRFVWLFLAPLQASVIFVFVLVTQIGHNLTYGKEKRLYTFPAWANGIGWMISCLPLLLLPLLVLYNLWKFARKGKTWHELFRLQPKWPSYGGGRHSNTTTATAAVANQTAADCSTTAAQFKLSERNGGGGAGTGRPPRRHRIVPAATFFANGKRTETTTAAQTRAPCTRF
uniref:Uncharacterized protein n=1 Tax=Globodera rostochiensis TaxID=31243 RepID=A0A914I3U4_GLORO